jgi:hypothetical protein
MNQTHLLLSVNKLLRILSSNLLSENYALLKEGIDTMIFTLIEACRCLLNSSCPSKWCMALERFNLHQDLILRWILLDLKVKSNQTVVKSF